MINLEQEESLLTEAFSRRQLWTHVRLCLSKVVLCPLLTLKKINGTGNFRSLCRHGGYRKFWVTTRTAYLDIATISWFVLEIRRLKMWFLSGYSPFETRDNWKASSTGFGRSRPIGLPLGSLYDKQSLNSASCKRETRNFKEQVVINTIETSQLN